MAALGQALAPCDLPRYCVVSWATVPPTVSAASVNRGEAVCVWPTFVGGAKQKAFQLFRRYFPSKEQDLSLLEAASDGQRRVLVPLLPLCVSCRSSAVGRCTKHALLELSQVLRGFLIRLSLAELLATVPGCWRGCVASPVPLTTDEEALLGLFLRATEGSGYRLSWWLWAVPVLKVLCPGFSASFTEEEGLHVDVGPTLRGRLSAVLFTFFSGHLASGQTLQPWLVKPVHSTEPPGLPPWLSLVGSLQKQEEMLEHIDQLFLGQETDTTDSRIQVCALLIDLAKQSKNDERLLELLEQLEKISSGSFISAHKRLLAALDCIVRPDRQCGVEPLIRLCVRAAKACKQASSGSDKAWKMLQGSVTSQVQGLAAFALRTGDWRLSSLVKELQAIFALDDGDVCPVVGKEEAPVLTARGAPRRQRAQGDTNKKSQGVPHKACSRVAIASPPPPAAQVYAGEANNIISNLEELLDGTVRQYDLTKETKRQGRRWSLVGLS